MIVESTNGEIFDQHHSDSSTSLISSFSNHCDEDIEDSIVIDLTQSIETPLLDSIQIVNIDVNLVNDIYDLTTTSSPNPSPEVIVIDDDTPNSSPLHQRHHIESRIIIPRSQSVTIASDHGGNGRGGNGRGRGHGRGRNGGRAKSKQILNGPPLPDHSRNIEENQIYICAQCDRTLNVNDTLWTLGCGHIVCRVCGNRFLARKKITCPSCHARTKPSSMVKLYL
ncbi:hypothetical protein Glove_116g52 [Diversispora epigaea]|uniref:RING-type domain-containing protein n=1 Tax=Diversispora epigaea TaxID=1348612 RepID=A0A397J3E9_9GLOM|nr:hypothetical protein Glove_116g52 [Diversispora epigaea]